MQPRPTGDDLRRGAAEPLGQRLIYKEEISTDADRVKADRCMIEEVGEPIPLVQDRRLELMMRSDISDLPGGVAGVSRDWQCGYLEPAPAVSRQVTQTERDRRTGPSQDAAAELAKLRLGFPIITDRLLDAIKYCAVAAGEEPVEYGIGITNPPIRSGNQVGFGHRLERLVNYVGPAGERYNPFSAGERGECAEAGEAERQQRHNVGRVSGNYVPEVETCDDARGQGGGRTPHRRRARPPWV